MVRVAVRSLAAAVVLCAAGCATLEPHLMVLRAPGETVIGELEVRCRAQGGSMEITIANRSDHVVNARISVPRAVIGGSAAVERRQTGWREVVVCDGSTCRIEREPVYELFDARQPILARVSVSPNRLRIPPAGEGRCSVILLNPAESTAEFTLRVHVRTGGPGDASLEIDCPSTVLLDGG